MIAGGLFKARVWLFIVALAASISAIALVQSQLNQLRIKHHLTDTSVVENAPPTVAFVVVALGGFRGLLADLLFLRAQKMQDQENYFELPQLGSWIVQLQPRFTGAIAFLAWNMSYNISVTFSSYEDRWRWVQRGIELIRDEAFNYHSGDPDLYRELGWIYQHKLGQNLDDANRYYKYQLALQFIEVIGNDRRFDWAAFADVPLSQEALFLGYTAAQRRDLDAALTAAETTLDKLDASALPASLTAAFPTLSEALAQRTEKWQRLQALLAANDSNYAKLEAGFRRDRHVPEAIAEALKAAGLFEEVDRHLRRRWFADRFRLDPETIAQMIAEYGFLDFRLPEAHAIYWARQGLARAKDHSDIGCERMIFQSMNDAYFKGRLLYISLQEVPRYVSTRNLELIDSVKQAYLTAREHHPDNRSIMSGFENFMVDAIVNLYTARQQQKAKSYLQYMRDHEQFGANQRYHKPLERFVLDELGVDISEMSQEQAQNIVQNFLIESCFNLATGEYDRATGYELMARKVHSRYQAESAGDARQAGRRGLQPFPIVRRQIIKMCDQVFDPELRQRLEVELRLRGEQIEQPGEDSDNILESQQPKELPIQRN